MYDELTPSDIKKMQEEIEYRKITVRQQALADVKEARAHGDLSENFEYHAAKKVKNQNESRIRYLERMIKTAKVISEESAYKMIIMMRGVIDGGTGSRMRRLYNITAPMGGKTGTTNDNTDGWFIGYTPRLCFGAWVGGDERDVHFASMAVGQGANSALPIAAYFLQKVYADNNLGYSQSENFGIPARFDPCSSVIDEDDGISDVDEEEIGFDTDAPAEEEE